MQWHHTDSRRSARQASPGSTSQVFLSFREFCTASKVAWRRTLFPWDKVTPHVRAERAFAELCHHYGASCLSYAEAVAPGLYANRTGFTLDDVAADCLHPDQGRYGNAYASDILRHWLRQAARRVSSAPPAAGPADVWRLPPPCNATYPAAVHGPDKVLRLQTEADGRPRPAPCTLRCTLRCPLHLCTSVPLRLCIFTPLCLCTPLPLRPSTARAATCSGGGTPLACTSALRGCGPYHGTPPPAATAVRRRRRVIAVPSLTPGWS